MYDLGNQEAKMEILVQLGGIRARLKYLAKVLSWLSVKWRVPVQSPRPIGIQPVS
jgi:hypothetical protein